MIVFDVQKGLWEHANSGRGNLMDSRAVARILARGLEKERKRCEQTARLILEAQPYVGSCFEGLLAIQSPLRIVAKYYIRANARIAEGSQVTTNTL